MAEEQHGAETEPRSHHPWFVAGELGGGTGSHHASELGLGAGLTAGHRPTPLLWLGGSYRSFRSSGNDGEELSVQSVTATAELHPLGSFWFDPYLVADAGWGRWRSGYQHWRGEVDWTDQSSGLAAGLGLGFTFVLYERVGVGLQYRSFFRGSARYYLAGPRVDVRF